MPGGAGPPSVAPAGHRRRDERRRQQPPGTESPPRWEAAAATAAAAAAAAANVPLLPRPGRPPPALGVEPPLHLRPAVRPRRGGGRAAAPRKAGERLLRGAVAGAVAGWGRAGAGGVSALPVPRQRPSFRQAESRSGSAARKRAGRQFLPCGAHKVAGGKRC